jgi:hypothetical protein
LGVCEDRGFLLPKKRRFKKFWHFRGGGMAVMLAITGMFA